MSDESRLAAKVDTFPYSPHAETDAMKARERELYRLLNPKGPKNGMELRVIGWARVDVRLLGEDGK